MELITQYFPAFLLVFCRISSFMVVAPIFSTKSVPRVVKIGLSFFISYIVFMQVGFNDKVVADGYFIMSIIKEVMAGLIIGYVCYMFFTIVQTSGAIMDMQMGLSMANIIDPLTGLSVPIMGNLKNMLLMLVFLAINGHHYLIRALMDSYNWLPLDNNLFGIINGGTLTEFLARTFADTFLLALQISAPLVVAMFLLDLALALLTRAAPQFQVFVIGVPIKILIGLAILILILPGFGTLFQMIFDRMFNALEQLFVIFQS
ncbi:flagellar biosynthetic protein FliR [Cohnella thailandensis]|uniref:Flagellar biosynthetic protein FliR n=1 Tax=Cohnella thailandensis TaxID=557557 RepID=A0A841T1I7_9BACL|nr:flagellar biosynthetic protein FliR [Cohnella thailandensis]MBB6636716.1 flagellar type III secretion system protein FliR [Cohnella thailandensis]MBP1973408.1 flagellar biosynthetic protein FliR [Cohnella thailandensis]